MTAKFKISAAKWPRNCRFSPRNDREIHVFDLSRYREIWHNLPRQTNAPELYMYIFWQNDISIDSGWIMIINKCIHAQRELNTVENNLSIVYKKC